jgi:hypothetical protein
MPAETLDALSERHPDCTFGPDATELITQAYQFSSGAAALRIPWRVLATFVKKAKGEKAHI